MSPAADTPDFVERSRLLAEAYRTAEAGHHGPRRLGDTDIDHPVEVARLLAEAGFADEVVAAGLLHDVIEDTSTELTELEARFGPEVADMVGQMTEDGSIEPYADRKAAHRQRALGGGEEVAAIYVADKLAKARAIRRDQVAIPDARLEHYRATLLGARQAHPGLPFLWELDEALSALPARRRRATAR